MRTNNITCKQGVACYAPTIFTATLVLAIAFTFNACSGDDNGGGGDGGGNSSSSAGGVVTCVSGNFETATIGTQTWMAENLNCIPSKGNSWCYDNNPENCKKYGRLYDFATAKTVCPAGWHLPSGNEWRTLSDFVENDKGCTKCDAKLLKATMGWEEDCNEGMGSGTDDYNFSALSGGLRGWQVYGDVGKRTGWWSATEDYGLIVFAQTMSNCSDDTYWGDINIMGGMGLSVRCVQDGSGVDGDKSSSSGGEAVSCVSGNFKTAVIGTQTWMAENLNCIPSKGISKCYDNDPANCEIYGRLYDWQTAMAICPSGWHLPKIGEWDILYRFVWNDIQLLNATSGWQDEYGNGTDNYGFSALPGGRGSIGTNYSGDFADYFEGAGDVGQWWSASEPDYTVAFNVFVYNTYYYYYGNKNAWYSVRCVKD